MDRFSRQSGPFLAGAWTILAKYPSYRDAVFIMPSGGRITVERWFSAGAYRLSEVRFADGTVWTKSYITNLSAQFGGTDAGETVTGTSGNDILTGGLGDDRLEGGLGGDTYIWNPGDGNDTIYDLSGKNILAIGEGVTPSEVKLSRTGTSYRDAVLIMPSGERVTVERWFSGSAYQIDEIHFNDGTVWTRQDVNAMGVTLEGTAGNDTIAGSDSSDIIYGYEGNDSLKGGSGSDTLIGGPGDDLLNGEAGGDTYIWNPGDGNDSIHDLYGTNVLALGEGIEPHGVKFTRAGTSHRDAVFIMPSGERITVEMWFSGAGYQMDVIRFADGTAWTRQDVNAFSPLFEGTDSPETIQGSPGNDTIIGGKGNDRLEGSGGGDTYVWNPGDGNDTIYDLSGSNALELGEGVNPTDLALSRSGNNLVIELNDASSGMVTVEKWYTGSAYRLAEMRFNDGTAWTRADITAIAAGTKEPFSVALSGGSGRAARVASANDPSWISMEGWEKARQNQASDGASGGGCAAGASGLIAFGAALLAGLLRSRRDSR
jgi:Ca2+-binding RTX toxin-like protein